MTELVQQTFAQKAVLGLLRTDSKRGVQLSGALDENALPVAKVYDPATFDGMSYGPVDQVTLFLAF